MIKLVPDVGAPVAVAAVNIGIKATQPTWEEWGKYGMSAVGYGSALMGFGRGDMGDFLKNVGIAALPGALEKLYDRVRAVTTPGVTRPTTTSQRLQYRPASKVSRYPAPAFDSEFANVRLD